MIKNTLRGLYCHTTKLHQNVQKYVRDNRRGHILHTMFTSATKMPSCLKYEERGDLTQSCLEEIFFTTFPGGVSTPNLTGVGLGHNLGYIFQDSLKKFMNASANIHSAVKRSKWVGITYNQQLPANDQKTQLSTEGFLFKN